MLPVSLYPFFRIALFFALGIGMYVWAPDWGSYFNAGFLCCVTLFFVLFCFRYRNQVLMGILAHLVCLLGGAFVGQWHDERRDALHFSKSHQDIVAYQALVDEELIIKPKSISTRLKVMAIKTNGRWRRASGSVLVYFPVDSESASLAYGDRLLIKGRPEEVKAPCNPGEYDYKRYLGYKNIFHRQFVKNGFAWRLRNEPISWMWKWAYDARACLSSILKKQLGNGQEFAVASMLVLGVRQSMDAELMQAYSVSGAIHVLSVSGLHVGLVFALLNLLLGRLAKHRIALHFFYAVSILSIWGFGLVTAFSPSVLRAVIMFSVVLVGKWINRKGSLYNTLGFTAFVILLFSPFTLMNVGFQLSFLAVLGIVYLQPSMVAIWVPKTKVAKWLWEVSCVSICAQVATFPLAMLHFNQFPTYFLLANLWVVPAAAAVLYMGIFYFVGCFWLVSQKMLGVLLYYSVWALNKSMFLVAQLPFAAYHGAGWEVLDCLLLYALLLSFVFLFYFRNWRYLVLALCVAWMVSGRRVFKIYTTCVTKQMVIYSVKGKACLGVINGGEAKIWCAPQLRNDSAGLAYAVLSPLQMRGVEHIRLATLPPVNCRIQIGRFKAVLLQRELHAAASVGLDDVDLVYLSYPCRKVPDFVALCVTKPVVLQHNRDLRLLKYGSNVWDLQAKGAFIVDL